MRQKDGSDGGLNENSTAYRGQHCAGPFLMRERMRALDNSRCMDKVKQERPHRAQHKSRETDARHLSGAYHKIRTLSESY